MNLSVLQANNRLTWSCHLGHGQCLLKQDSEDLKSEPESDLSSTPGIPETPGTPHRGKGTLGVEKSIPLPLPSLTPGLYPGSFHTPCHSLPVTCTRQNPYPCGR
jgi:hypothetical protein